MEYNNNTTECRKNKHLNDFERGQIELLVKKGYSPYKIAKEINRSSNTVRNELKRGTVTQIRMDKEVEVYYPDTGKLVYEKHRAQSKKSFKLVECAEFIEFVEEKYKKDNWSLDAICGYAESNNLFEGKRVCTKTLYNYVSLGLINIKSIDLPLKVRRKVSTKHKIANRKKLGKNIEQRPIEIEDRKTFGHWEIDTVIPKRNKEEPTLLTLTERKTRMEIIFKLSSNKAVIVNNELEKILKSIKNPSQIFKTITSDNGSEFTDLTNLEGLVGDVYYCHPNNPQERGTNEKHNSLIRRFLPKGKSLNDYENCHYLKIMNWMNTLPRKILNYKTPLELFVEELNNLKMVDELERLVQFDIAI